MLSERVQASVRGKSATSEVQTYLQLHPTEGEEEVANADEAGELHAQEETEAKHVLRTPTLPSQAEIDEHWLDHLPYRSWCGTCVSGRGRERPHTRTHGKRKIPTLAFDYCFISKEGTFSREEWSNM